MTDRALLQQALEALEANLGKWAAKTKAVSALRERLAHCDRCGKKLGGPDHIHTCSPQQPMFHLRSHGDVSAEELERLAQPVQEPKLSCGVDFADGLLTVSVGRICADGSMEVIHCEQIEIPVQEPVAHSIVAGALFDFMGWLTTRSERLVLSSTDDAAPAADAIKDFAQKRNLSINDAQVQEWQECLATPQPRQWQGLTPEDMPDGEDPVYDDRLFLKGMAWADAVLMKKNGGGA